MEREENKMLNNDDQNIIEAIFSGKNPATIVLIKEVDQILTNYNDFSGHAQGFIGTLINYMQTQNATGIIVNNNKYTNVITQSANMFDIPIINIDVSKIKANLVGEFEQNFQQILNTIPANNIILVFVTCNSIQTIPTELRRKFGIILPIS